MNTPSLAKRCCLTVSVAVALIGLAGTLLLLAAAPALAAPTSNVLVGTDRYDTAIMVSQEMFAGALPAGAGMVLAPGETFAEALCGAPLASAWGGPVLLTPGIGLNNGVASEMVRLAPARVFCIGLSDTVVNAVKAALPAATVVTIRGAGGSVYNMSRQVANALETKVGDMTGATAIITMGTLFPDAIGVSPLACKEKWPIVLTNAVSGALHADALGTLTDLGITQALKVGTYATLPAGVTGVGNLSGADRYYTNRNVALWAEDHAGLLFAHLGVVTGEKFPDALAAGPYLALDQGILLLTKDASAPAPTADVVVTHAAEIDNVDYIGLADSGIWLISSLLPGVPPPYTPTLAFGSTGPAVSWLEGRLTSLTYRPGPVDGAFDNKTYFGLIGFQKYEGLALDGQVDADDWARLAAASKPVATQATTGTWVEVDKDRQVLLYVVEGVVTKSLAVSTGSPDVGIETPEGMFTITKKVPNWANGMYYLSVFYFDAEPPVGQKGIGDIGIHGLSQVPNVPASHGCVRVTVWDIVELYPQLPLTTRVFIY